MCDRDDGAGVAVEELLEPRDRFRVEMVGRLVQQQHVRFRQQQPAECDAAALAAGQLRDVGVPFGQPQRIGRHLELAIDFPAVRRVDLVLQFALLLEQRRHLVVVERFGETIADLVEALHERERSRDAFLDEFADGLGRVEFRLLRQVTDLDAGLRPGLALDLGVDAGHDPQQGRLAGAVQAEHADLRAGEKAQGDVAQDVPLRWHDLPDLVHRIYVLGHVAFRSRKGTGIIREAGSLANLRAVTIHRHE